MSTNPTMQSCKMCETLIAMVNSLVETTEETTKREAEEMAALMCRLAVLELQFRADTTVTAGSRWLGSVASWLYSPRQNIKRHRRSQLYRRL